MSVLVVDDDLINRKLLQAILKKSSIVHEVKEATNGSEALTQLEINSDINLIFLDIVMPVMNGLEFTKIIRSNPKYSHIPVIILSTDDTKKSEMLEAGADGFIRKPIKEDDIFEKIAYYS